MYVLLLVDDVLNLLFVIELYTFPLNVLIDYTDRMIVAVIDRVQIDELLLFA